MWKILCKARGHGLQAAALYQLLLLPLVCPLLLPDDAATPGLTVATRCFQNTEQAPASDA